MTSSDAPSLRPEDIDLVRLALHVTPLDYETMFATFFHGGAA